MTQLLDRPGTPQPRPPEPHGPGVALARAALAVVRQLARLERWWLGTAWPAARHWTQERGRPAASRISGNVAAELRDVRARVSRRRASGQTPPGRRLPRWARFALVPVIAFALFVGVTLTPALLAPGSDTTVARVAEWAREYGLGPLVTLAEQAQYQLEKPAEGGALAGGIATVGTVDRSRQPIPSRVSPALPGEGQWQYLQVVKGKPVSRVAFLRPDATHTGFSVGVVEMDAHALKFALHQGTHVPGGKIVAPTSLTTEEKKTVLAAFNSGFQMKDANGGYWQNGTTIQPLTQGAASMVFGTDGSLKVQSWPGGEPGQGVAAVRQNLVLLVDNGQVTPEVASDNPKTWGVTVGNKAYVWRTAVGTKADGSVVFIVGPALNVETLASLAKDAGCVEAMELDINTDWTNYITYSQPGAVPKKLTPDEFPNANRYGSASTRDFVAVLPR